MVAVEGHIFEHYIENGELGWDEITSLGDIDAEHFINSFLTPAEVSNSQFIRSNLDYWLDHVDFDLNLLVTTCHHPNERLPRYLVYTDILPEAPASSVRRHGWCFDLDRTLTANGIPIPADAGQVVDVSVVAGSTTSGWPTREDMMKRGGKEIYTQTFPASSSKWTSFDYEPSSAPTGHPLVTCHTEFRFGFHAENSQTYTFCWRGSDIFRTQYPSPKLDEWMWTVSNGGGLGPDLVFFRVRKPN